MSAVHATANGPATTTYPDDVLEFARAKKVEGYLDPLVEMTRRRFPTGQIRLSFKKDPEIHDLHFIICEARVPIADVPNYLAATNPWIDEFLRLVPSSLRILFVLQLHQID
jgi:hypothetical protein